MTNEERIAVLENEIKALREARDLQNREYERRLDNLNHANERIDLMQARSVSTEVYTVQHKILVDQVKELQTFKDNQQGRQIIVPLAVSFVMSVLVLIINRFIGG